MTHVAVMQVVLQFIAPLAAVCASVYGYIRGRSWLHAFHLKIDIVKDNARRVEALEDQVRALSITATNWRETAASVQAKVERLEVIVPKFNAAIRYIHALIDYAMKVERAAKRAGASLRSFKMPPIPLELEGEIEWHEKG